MHRVLLGATGGFAAGLGVVSGCAYLVNESTPAPAFSTRGSRFQNDNFQGRFGNMLSTMDPCTLLASDEQVRQADALLKRFEQEGASVASNAELWRARQTRDSAMHPDTKEIIPRPFRMAGYVPFNGPVCVAMMISSTTPALLFWNWVNQSQNALVNYYNRNASSPSTNEDLAKSYGIAVSAAVLVAFGTSQLIQRRFDPATAKRMLTFVALPTCMIASSSNAYIMRSPEIASGIALVDSNGLEVVPGARSSQAAKRAVMETVQSRIIMQLPTFFFPPMIMMVGPLAAAAAASQVVNVSANVFLTLAFFGLGLPASVAVFPVMGEIKVEDIDLPHVKQAALDKGLKAVYYNKGL